MSWEDEYSTTKFRGPQKYPVPEDWVLGMVEGDGVDWRRYDDFDDTDAKHKREVPHEIAYEGPDDELALVRDFEGDAMNPDGEYQSVMLNGEELIKVKEDAKPFGELAELMMRVANGEDYDDVLKELEGVRYVTKEEKREKERKERQEELEQKRAEHATFDDFDSPRHS